MVDVILPVLDEAAALPWVLGRMPPGFRPLVADNGSSDGSDEIALQLGARLVREPRRGFGAACHAGLLAARSEVVCFMDCDGSLDPRELPLVAGPVLAGERELMLGARSPERGAWPLHARLANRVLALELRRRSGVRLTDLGPMRAAPRRGRGTATRQDRTGSRRDGFGLGEGEQRDLPLAPGRHAWIHAARGDAHTTMAEQVHQCEHVVDGARATDDEAADRVGRIRLFQFR